MSFRAKSRNLSGNTRSLDSLSFTRYDVLAYSLHQESVFVSTDMGDRRPAYAKATVGREVIIRPRRTKNDTAQYIFLEYTTDSSFDHILPSISVGARFLPKRLSSSLACCETNKDAEVCSLLLTHTNLYKCLIPHRPRKGKVP